MPGKRLIAIIMSAGVFLQSAGTTPADSLDTAVYELQTITVSAPVSRRVLKMERDGAIDLLADHLGEQVTFLGGGDPLAIVRSLPSVATANDLQATVNVRGAATGDNLFAPTTPVWSTPCTCWGFSAPSIRPITKATPSAPGVCPRS